jgi:hypothetical protein
MTHEGLVCARRFSEFVDFHRCLKAVWPRSAGSMPPLPRKQPKLWGYDVSASLRARRVQLLSQYLEKVSQRACPHHFRTD